MLVGALFAFLSSFNEAVVVIFIGGRGAATLPKKMYESIRLESDPVIAVVSTLLVSAVVLGVLVSAFLRPRGANAALRPAPSTLDRHPQRLRPPVDRPHPPGGGRR